MLTLATRLANDPETPARLRSLRRDMRAQIRKAPVCDAQALAREMERLMEELAG
jgi:predicted O-linked N-acetylglucosamine transferase (SPINDLY family)